MALPASLGLILLREPLISFLYQRDKFDAHDVQLTAWALLWFAAGLVGHSVMEVLTRAFYAQQDTRTPVLIGMIAMGLNVVFSFTFAWLFGQLGWLPHAGLRSPGYETSGWLDTYLSLDFLQHLILPVVVSGLYYAGLPLLLMRNTMLEVLGQDYVRSARAKGISPWRVYRRHALRNALIPVITLFGLTLPTLLSGAVITETIFSWPGLGYLGVLSVEQRDYPVVLAFVMVGGFGVVLGNLLADVLYGVADPRIKY